MSLLMAGVTWNDSRMIHSVPYSTRINRDTILSIIWASIVSVYSGLTFSATSYITGKLLTPSQSYDLDDLESDLESSLTLCSRW